MTRRSVQVMKQSDETARNKARDPGVSGPEETAGRAVRIREHLIVLFAAFLFAAQSPTTKIFLGKGFTSYEIATTLFLLGAVIIDGWLIATRRWSVIRDGLDHWKIVLLISTLNFVQTSTYFLTLRYVDAGIGIVLLYLNPCLVCLFFMITKLRPVSRGNRIAVILSLCGTILAVDVLFSGFGKVSLTGILLGLLVASFCAANAILTDLKGGEVGAVTLLAFELTVGAVIGLITDPGIFRIFAGMSAVDWGSFALVALLTKVLSLYLLLRGFLRIGAARATVIMVCEVPFTLLLSYFVLGERMDAFQLMGVAMIIAAVILLQKSPGGDQ